MGGKCHVDKLGSFGIGSYRRIIPWRIYPDSYHVFTCLFHYRVALL